MNTKGSVFVLSALLIASIFAACVAIPDAEGQAGNYLAYWNFDEGAGSTADDSSAHNYEGTITGADWVSGISGSALDFNGFSDHVTIVNSAILNNLNALTYEAWIKPTADSHWHVISKGTGSKRLYSEAWQSTLDLTGRVRYSNNHAYATSVNNTVTLNEWQHVAMTWSNTDDSVRVYRNGVEVSYAGLSSGSGTIENDGAYPYVIGGRSDLSPGTFFDGTIDEVYLWDRVLTPTVIQSHYESLAFPSAPLNVTASPGDESVTLRWRAPSFEGGSPVTGYRIYRGTASGATTYIYETGNVNLYIDTSLTNGLRYYYTITALNANGEGVNSTEVSTVPASVPSQPLNPIATPGDQTVRLDWQDPTSDGGSPVLEYRIYRGTVQNALTYLASSSTVFYNDTGLTNNQTYYYRVAAVNEVGEGANSTLISARPSTVQTVPTAPQNLQVTGSAALCALTWNSPSSNGGSIIIGYRIYRGVSPGSETLLLTVGNVNQYDDTSVINGREYYYQVSALNAIGEGARSAEASATPTSSGSGGGGISIWLLLLIVVIIVAIILVFAVTRKKEGARQRPVEGGMPCHHCGTIINENAAMCYACGAMVVPPAPSESKKEPYSIELGRNHLFLTENMDETFRTFKSIVDWGKPGLCLTNRFPEKLRADYALHNARIIWFSDSAMGPDIFRPQRLDFEITKTTMEFIRGNKEPVILLDCLDYLILTNGFENVSAFLKRITDVAAMEKATLVVIVRPDALTSERISYLKGQFDRVV